MFMGELGNRLKLIRKNRTQEEFASRYGIPQGTLSKFERGKLEPGIDFLTQVSKGEGVSIHWLLTGERDEKTGKWLLREPETEYETLPVSIRRVLDGAIEILESSNGAVIEALKANIRVYLETIRAGKKSDKDKGAVK